MKKVILLLASTVPFAGAALAEPVVYGKANVSLQANDENGASTTDLVSNASRIGVMGSETISDSLKAIYRFEFEAHIDDGKDSDGNTFSQRDIFVGLQGDSWGTVIAGKFNTPFKQAGKPVDLFNDLEGDLKSIMSKSENRESNSVQYSTPSSWGPVKATIDYIASEDENVDDGVSTSVVFEQEGLYLALAYDMDVEKDSSDETADVYRLVAQYSFGDFKVGGLYEDQDPNGASTLKDGDAWLVSAQYKMDKTTFKAQYGESDIVNNGGETYSVGVDYKLNKQAKLFGFYTAEEADGGLDKDYLGVGVELKF